MMAGVLVMMLIHFHRQNRDWLSRLNTPDERTLRHLLSLVRGRGWMICYLWMLLTLGVIYHSLQRTENAAITSPPHTIAPATPAPSSTGGDPARSGIQREIEIDQIKTYFEDAYVSYYYLYKCKAAGPEDNVTLYRVLLQKLEVLDATDYAPQIMSAARGSYEVIYSVMGCEEDKLSPVRTRFQAFMASLQTPTP